MQADFIVENIGQLVTPRGSRPLTGRRAGEIAVHQDAMVASREGRIVYAGAMRGAEIAATTGGVRIDAGGRAVIPGFVDSHTHLPFAGDRSNELLMRLQGKSYQEIAAAGGGIASTVKATRAIGEEELREVAGRRLDRMLLHGTTTVEAKSGYGLNLEDEMKQLRVLRALAATHPTMIVPTCMCAHDFPPEYRQRREEYVELIGAEILPAVRSAGLAEFFDVFVETGVYTVEQGERLCRRAAEIGFGLKVHADELSDTGGAAMAASVGAVSAEHLLFVSADGIRRMADAGVIATLLPCVPLFLMMDRWAPARAMIDAGVPVAIATDFNPGSSYTESMPLVIQLACFKMKMSIEEALVSATLNAACGIRRAHDVGSLEPGKSMDALILESDTFVDVVYHLGMNPVRAVIKSGRVVARDGRLDAITIS